MTDRRRRDAGRPPNARPKGSAYGQRQSRRASPRRPPARPDWLDLGPLRTSESTKYDGSPHYNVPCVEIERSDTCLVAYQGPGVLIDSYRGQWYSRGHCLKIFWTDRDYNLHVNWRNDWSARSHYVNVATPAVLEGSVVRFVDLDLDVIWKNADVPLYLDDEDEFHHHRKKWSYPPDLIERCWQAKDELFKLFTEQVYPFDGSLYAWRPGRGVTLA